MTASAAMTDADGAGNGAVLHEAPGTAGGLMLFM